MPYPEATNSKAADLSDRPLHAQQLLGQSRHNIGGSRPVSFPSSTDGKASSTVGTYQEDDLAGTKQQRHQAKQACQQCRRRKIKCDETRPKCKSCDKAKLICEYELLAGQTRQQALVEGQSKIQHRLEAHASLVSTLRTLPADTAVDVLNRLRAGQYDEILLGRAGTQDGSDGLQGNFLWEYPVDNTEEDVSGEDNELYTDSTVSHPQDFSQTLGGLDTQSLQQSNQMSSFLFAAMPQVKQNPPNPGYYPPYMAYQNPPEESHTYGIDMSGMHDNQFRPEAQEMSQQASQQQLHMHPLAEDSQDLMGQQSKKTRRH